MLNIYNTSFTIKLICDCRTFITSQQNLFEKSFHYARWYKFIPSSYMFMWIVVLLRQCGKYVYMCHNQTSPPHNQTGPPYNQTGPPHNQTGSLLKSNWITSHMSKQCALEYSNVEDIYVIRCFFFHIEKYAYMCNESRQHHGLIYSTMDGFYIHNENLYEPSF